MGKQKRPGFVKRDENKIQATEDNGGLSESTKKGRKSTLNIFNNYQEFNERPSLEDVCSNINEKMKTCSNDEMQPLITELEDDLKGFFSTYYIQLATEADEKKDQKSEDQKSEDPESTDQNEEESEDQNENKENLDENIRPAGNTALSKKSHLKMMILDFTGQKLDITNAGTFPNFNVST